MANKVNLPTHGVTSEAQSAPEALCGLLAAPPVARPIIANDVGRGTPLL
jgi:hypothetical protein